MRVNGPLSKVNANIVPNNDERAKSDPVLVDPENPVDLLENSTTTVHAVTETTKTVWMPESGLSLVGLLLAVLMLLGGLATSKK